MPISFMMCARRRATIRTPPERSEVPDCPAGHALDHTHGSTAGTVHDPYRDGVGIAGSDDAGIGPGTVPRR